MLARVGNLRVVRRSVAPACAIVALLCGGVRELGAQRRDVLLSRADALELAARRSPRIALAQADAAAAAAALQLARQWDNPTLSASYSKSEPNAHLAIDIPIDFPRLRAARTLAARSDLAAVAVRVQFGRALLALDVDTAYTRAEALVARSLLSLRTARDADSLLAIANVRRDAGDASDLDLELAQVYAGQSHNTAARDSLAAINGRVALQALIGLTTDSVTVTLADSLTLTDGVPSTDGATLPALRSATEASAARANRMQGARPPLDYPSLPEAAALRNVEANRYRVLIEQRRRIAPPALSVGVESVNAGSNALLPTVGVALPLPFFNRNAANVHAAEAELDRAQAALALVRVEQAAIVASARREAEAAGLRAVRSRQLVASGDRIATLSLIAYREGAAALATVLDAQRAARETLAGYIDDLAGARIAVSLLRFVTLAPSKGAP